MIIITFVLYAYESDSHNFCYAHPIILKSLVYNHNENYLYIYQARPAYVTKAMTGAVAQRCIFQSSFFIQKHTVTLFKPASQKSDTCIVGIVHSTCRVWTFVVSTPMLTQYPIKQENASKDLSRMATR